MEARVSSRVERVRELLDELTEEERELVAPEWWSTEQVQEFIGARNRQAVADFLSSRKIRRQWMAPAGRVRAAWARAQVEGQGYRRDIHG